jgi:hypothetical protein
VDEHTWLTGTGPKWMLEHVRTTAGDRKLRLFGCACVRRIDHLLDDRLWEVLATAERLADGRASLEQVSLADALTVSAIHDRQVAARVVGRMLRGDAWGVAHVCTESISLRAAGRSWVAELAAQCDLLRCLLGNPFRPVAHLDRAWLAANGGAVGNLAAGIYEEQRWADLPVLGDALEEAGCTHQPILDHCHHPGAHARGCWVVDAVLGKT